MPAIQVKMPDKTLLNKAKAIATSVQPMDHDAPAENQKVLADLAYQTAEAIEGIKKVLQQLEPIREPLLSVK
jgi:hypothetical protein